MNNTENKHSSEKEYSNINELNTALNNIDNLTILHLNIRSLNANFNLLETFLESLKIKPKVLICTESWILQHYQLFNLQGYKMYYNFGKLNKADGVVMYISETI